MPRKITRPETIRHLETVREQLTRTVAEIDSLIALLNAGPKTNARPYDAPPLAPEEIERRFGIEPDEDGDIPEWVRERMARMLGERL